MLVRKLLDKETLDRWLEEFLARGYLTSSEIRVLEQDDEQDPDAGLIVVDLSRANTISYLQPVTGGHGTWKVTMEPRESVIELGAADLVNLGHEVTVLGSLLCFLESQSKILLAQSL